LKTEKYSEEEQEEGKEDKLKAQKGMKSKA